MLRLDSDAILDMLVFILNIHLNPRLLNGVYDVTHNLA